MKTGACLVIEFSECAKGHSVLASSPVGICAAFSVQVLLHFCPCGSVSLQAHFGNLKILDFTHVIDPLESGAAS